MSYTPGPWKAAEAIGYDEGNTPYVCIFSLSDAEIAPSRAYGDTEKELWANARLIAAAPELVAAAKAALWIITTTNMCAHVRRPGSTCGKCKTINDLESVLARVKGE